MLGSSSLEAFRCLGCDDSGIVPTTKRDSPRYTLTGMGDNSTARRRRAAAWLLLPLFLSSGATSLVYETLWARQLQLVFGTSQVAIAAVLAAFMAGLAVGGFAAARWAGRVARPLSWYAGLEAFIGLYALREISRPRCCWPTCRFCFAPRRNGCW